MKNTERRMKNAVSTVLESFIPHSPFTNSPAGAIGQVGELGRLLCQDDAVLGADGARLVFVGAFIDKLGIGQGGVAHDE